ncbi:MAG TPA: tRNA (adenosine(37)-N6)-threonylcarbamoyltransferase complex ATPase subunit type 1 TsaE [Gemmatimonadaceae bacterium]|nr:tRNA (adenosine(37)-N6)-threonylcarbamoyltransferase complex ATPase subunit type 1 TsaE [Gemmatimonadaceae bacterium]
MTPAFGSHIVPPLAPHGRLALTESELENWGGELGHVAEPPLIVAISGELGAGKTTLVRSICRGYGVSEDVTSPTYALVHEYTTGRGPVFHLDLFRVEHPRELTNLGWDDIIQADALVLVEWPERAGDRLPPSAVHLDLEHIADDPDRRLLLAG